MTERADASGCIPSPGEGKGLGMGLRPFLMKGRWDGLEHPSRRLGHRYPGLHFVCCPIRYPDPTAAVRERGIANKNKK